MLNNNRTGEKIIVSEIVFKWRVRQTNPLDISQTSGGSDGAATKRHKTQTCLSAATEAKQAAEVAPSVALGVRHKLSAKHRAAAMLRPHLAPSCRDHDTRDHGTHLALAEI